MENNLHRDLDIFEAYIETPEKYEWYKKVFASYDVNGVEKFSLNWSWFSFFFAPIHLAYRKCYIEALLIWIVQFVFSPSGVMSSIIFSIGCAVISPWLIYKRYRRTVDNIAFSGNDRETKIEMAKKLGGVDKLARNIAIVLQFFVIFIVICQFLILLGFNLFFFNFMTPFIFIY